MKYRIFSFLLIEEDDVKNFWTPDIIIDQAGGVDNTMMMKMAMVMLNCTQVKEARVPTLILDPVSVRLHDDSKVAELNFAKNDDVFQVSWSKKMNFDVGCPMKFNHFPFE